MTDQQLATAWHLGEVLAFDTETTGTDVNTDRIVTATIARIRSGQTIDVRSWLINPGIPIPKAASDIHGISNKEAQAHGQNPAEAIAQIAHVLEAAAMAGTPVIAFNASFDLTVLARECRRHDCEFPALLVIDPYVLDKQLDKWRKGLRTLTATCQHYNVCLDGAHDATEDAIAAASVARHMAVLWPSELQIELAALHDKQVIWRYAAADEFQTYLRTKKGEVDAVINGEWPVQSLPTGWHRTARPGTPATFA